MSNPIYPAAIGRGSTIGLVLPSSMITEDQLQAVTEKLDAMGLKYKIGPYMQRIVRMFTMQQSDTPYEDIVSSLHNPEVITNPDIRDYQRYVASGYMAGSPQMRAFDINDFFADPDIDAIWCLRGGFSAAKVLPYLNYKLIRSNPKMVVGYSDLTNIINAIYQKSGVVAYHGPMMAPNFINEKFMDNGQVDQFTMGYFDQFIFNEWQSVQISNPPGLPISGYNGGQAEGRIVGGNLSVLAQNMGTPYQLDTAGKIVFIEEVRTHVPHLDMKLTQLQLGGFFDNIAGLIIGDFLDCHNRTGNDKCQKWGALPVMINLIDKLRCPIVAGVKIGHDKQTITIPIGANCSIDADNKQITIFR